MENTIKIDTTLFSIVSWGRAPSVLGKNHSQLEVLIRDNSKNEYKMTQLVPWLPPSFDRWPHLDETDREQLIMWAVQRPEHRRYVTRQEAQDAVEEREYSGWGEWLERFEMEEEIDRRYMNR